MYKSIVFIASALNNLLNINVTEKKGEGEWKMFDYMKLICINLFPRKVIY